MLYAPIENLNLRKACGAYLVLSYNIEVSECARSFVQQLRRVRANGKRERVLSAISFDIASINRLPQPMVLVVDEIDSRALIDTDDDTGGEVIGLYTHPLGVIYVANRRTDNGRARSWTEVLDTFCHEWAHHVDYCLWGESWHTCAFYIRVQHLVKELLETSQS